VTETPNRRTIMTSKTGGRGAVFEIVEAAFAAELLAPGPRFWVVSPWLSDVPVLDNSSGGYTTVCPDFARSRIPVSHVLAELVLRGTHVYVVTRPDEGGSVVRAVRSIAGEPAITRLHHVLKSDLHVKVMLGDAMALRGSMNLTFSGTELLDELESFTTDPKEIADIRVELETTYGGSA
jgi:hypothetical protein